MSEKLIELLRKRVKQTREWQQSETMTAALSDLDLAEIAVVERLDALESSLAQAQADVEALQRFVDDVRPWRGFVPEMDDAYVALPKHLRGAA